LQYIGLQNNLAISFREYLTEAAFNDNLIKFTRNTCTRAHPYRTTFFCRSGRKTQFFQERFFVIAANRYFCVIDKHPVTFNMADFRFVDNE